MRLRLSLRRSIFVQARECTRYNGDCPAPRGSTCPVSCRVARIGAVGGSARRSRRYVSGYAPSWPRGEGARPTRCRQRRRVGWLSGLPRGGHACHGARGHCRGDRDDQREPHRPTASRSAGCAVEPRIPGCVRPRRSLGVQQRRQPHKSPSRSTVPFLPASASGTSRPASTTWSLRRRSHRKSHTPPSMNPGSTSPYRRVRDNREALSP